MKILEFKEKKSWAVVGSVHNKEKFAYKIYKFLKAKGYTVYAVDPSGEKVDDEITYTSLKAIPYKLEAIDMVIHPSKADAFLEEAKELGITHIWFQPGAQEEKLITKASAQGMEVVYGKCVMVEF